MPLKPGPVRNAYQRDQYRQRRDRERWEREAKEREPVITPPEPVTDQVTALVEWAVSLIYPSGHPQSGQPMTLPPYLVDHLHRIWLHCRCR